MSNQAFISMFLHLVWGTKHKDSLITKDFQKKLYGYIYGITVNKNWHLIEIGGTQDHIHLLLQIRNFKYSPPEIVRCIKSNSSRYIRENFLKTFQWQDSYSALSVGRREVKIIKNYIQKQEEHHKLMSQEEEYVFMLKKNLIKYKWRPFYSE